MVKAFFVFITGGLRDGGNGRRVIYSGAQGFYLAIKNKTLQIKKKTETANVLRAFQKPSRRGGGGRGSKIITESLVSSWGM